MLVLPFRRIQKMHAEEHAEVFRHASRRTAYGSTLTDTNIAQSVRCDRVSVRLGKAHNVCSIASYIKDSRKSASWSIARCEKEKKIKRRESSSSPGCVNGLSKIAAVRKRANVKLSIYVNEGFSIAASCTKHKAASHPRLTRSRCSVSFPFKTIVSTSAQRFDQRS